MRRVLALLACVLWAAAGCGGSAGSGSSSPGGTLTVLAAASLTGAFTDLANTYQQQHPAWKVRLSFGGSDQLAAQIEQGVPADVYAAASTRYPEQLQNEKLLGETSAFATNSLVLIVPAGNPARVRSVSDLTRGVKLVIGDASVPIGAYTETVLGNLGVALGSLHVVSREQSVSGIVEKVELGETDAGFAYVTDALAAGEKVEQVALPSAAQATATYPIGIVSDSSHKKAAQEWIDLVTGPAGRRVLGALGFGPPPSS
jgi:molybdate transport system substrate-binding protein